MVRRFGQFVTSGCSCAVVYSSVLGGSQVLGHLLVFGLFVGQRRFVNFELFARFGSDLFVSSRFQSFLFVFGQD